MAAPSGTKWSSIFDGYGRLGIYTSIANSDDLKSTVTVQVWVWSKYSLKDTNNKLYFNNDSSSASTLIGSTNINHTVDTGEGWSTSNQTKIMTKTYTYTRTASSRTVYCAAKLSGIDKIYSGSKSMSITASYTIPAIPVYTISFNANGGTGAPSSVKKNHGTEITLPSAKPTRTGYSFQGWNSSSTATEATYTAGGKFTANRTVTLYAVWKANTYTITFNANGGSGGPSTQTKTHDKTLTLSTTKPTRANYNFLGWSTSSTATTATYAAGGSYTGNANVTLYAVWELAYTAPRITNVDVYRSDSNGDAADEGTYIHVSFDWATDKTVTSPITIYVKKTSVTTWSSATSTVSGTSGSISRNIGGSYSTEDAYDVKIEVKDSVGSSTITRLVPGTKYIIDFLNGGNGMAIGKPAKTSNLLDIFWNTSIDGTLKVNNIAVKGDALTPSTAINPIASVEEDTVDNWKPYRHSFQYFNTAGCVTDQPSTTGVVLNFGNMSSYIRQMWFAMTNGSIYHRGGGNGGWSGTWKTILDSSNYTNYAVSKDKHGLCVYESAGIDPDTTTEHLILTNKNTPIGGYMYIKTDFYSGKTATSPRMQIAFTYNKRGSVYYRLYHSNSSYFGGWTEWMPFGSVIAPGDTYTVAASAQFHGIITGSSQTVQGTLYLGTPIVATSVTLSGNFVVRGVKGYLNEMDYTTGVSVTASGYECSATIVDAARGVVNVRLYKTSAYTNATNNTPVAICSSQNTLLKLTFN